MGPPTRSPRLIRRAGLKRTGRVGGASPVLARLGLLEYKLCRGFVVGQRGVEADRRV